MKTLKRTNRPVRSELRGFHSYQGRLALERSLGRLKYRLQHPRFLEAPAR